MRQIIQYKANKQKTQTKSKNREKKSLEKQIKRNEIIQDKLRE